MCSCSAKVNFILFSLSATVLVISIFFTFFTLTSIFNNEIEKNAHLKDGTKQFARFVKTPFPLNFKIYIFNVENPTEILAGAKPIVKEKGPYVYKQFREKIIEVVSNDTVTYSPRTRFEFDSEESGILSDDDIVTVLNTPMMGMLQESELLNSASSLSNCFEEIFPEGSSSLFIQIKVKTLLFDGLNFCRNFTGRKDKPWCELFSTLACTLATSMRNIDKQDDGSLNFSFLKYKIEEPYGNLTVKRGLKNIKDVGSVVKWNGMDYTKYWTPENRSKCDHVDGSDGTIYPPYATKESVFKTFSTDICRSLDATYIKEKYYMGVKGYRYGLTNHSFKSNDGIDDCYCSKKTRDVNGEASCFLDGVLDLKPCLEAPVLLSFPHFLWSEKYVQGVEGLAPNESLHGSYVLLEPDTGTPLEGFSRMQFNMVFRPIKAVEKTSSFPRTVLPILWIEEGFLLGDDLIEELKSQYLNQKKFIQIACYVVIAVSSVLSLVFLGGMLKKKQ